MTRVLAIAAMLLLGAAAPAAASSIVYVKGGAIYRSSPSGTHRRVLVRAPGASAFHVVTQDDRGRVWGVHYPSRRWVRFSAGGRRLGSFRTAGTGVGLHYDPVRGLFGFAGPLDPQVSDDGRRIAHWGILETLSRVNPDPLPGEPDFFVDQNEAIGVVFANRDAVANRSTRFSELAWPSFLRDGTIVASAFSHLLRGDGVWYVPGGRGDPRPWFHASTLLRIAHPEATRRGDRLAAAVDTADGSHALARDDEIAVFELAGPPPAVPARACAVPNPNGTVAGLSWAPDGRRLAWADRRGVWVARFASTPTGCSLVGRRLLARGAASPDWGPR